MSSRAAATCSSMAAAAAVIKFNRTAIVSSLLKESLIYDQCRCSALQWASWSCKKRHLFQYKGSKLHRVASPCRRQHPSMYMNGTLSSNKTVSNYLLLVQERSTKWALLLYLRFALIGAARTRKDYICIIIRKVILPRTEILVE